MDGGETRRVNKNTGFGPFSQKASSFTRPFGILQWCWGMAQIVFYRQISLLPESKKWQTHLGNNQSLKKIKLLSPTGSFTRLCKFWNPPFCNFSMVLSSKLMFNVFAIRRHFACRVWMMAQNVWAPWCHDLDLALGSRPPNSRPILSLSPTHALTHSRLVW